MAFSLLSEIHKDSHHWTICVLVSRMWHYRGGTDVGPIKHTDLVLLDTEGTHMYGQLPPATAERLKDVLQEGKVFVIRKFMCNLSRPSFRHVESPFMVQFTKFSTVEEMPGLEDNYPFCTYNLTAFADILDPSGPRTHFIDVIGKISHVSDVVPVQSMGAEMRIVLWGDRACEFDADTICAMGDKGPVIAIFVGTLPKTHRGLDTFPTRVYADPVEMTMKELNGVDPFVDMEKRFICNVTIDIIGSDQRWWFASCSKCHKSAKHDGYQYQCSGENCDFVKVDLADCISVFDSDATGGAEFVMFNRVGAASVGKQLMTLMRQRYPGLSTVDEIAAAARHDTGLPAEICCLVGKKFKLLVGISKKWERNNDSEDLAFKVCRIMETYKPELPPLGFSAGLESGGVSSSANGPGNKIPPMGPVMSPMQYMPPALGSDRNQAFHAGYGSPVAQAHASPAARLSAATQAKGSSAPMRGTRCGLFTSPSKNKEQLVVENAVPVEEEPAPSTQVAVDAAVADVEVKEDNVVLTKTKRSTTNTKPGSTIKKSKV